MLKKSNLKKFERNFNKKLESIEIVNEEEYERLLKSLQGWFGYAIWANTYNLRKRIKKQIEEKFTIQKT